MAPHQRFSRGIAAAPLLALAACSHSPPPPPPPTIVELTITAAPAINPDVNGQPSPIALRIYQLAAASAFERADFFPLYQNDAAVLGADLVGRDEITVSPSQTVSLTLQPKAATKLLGFIAAFRNIDRADWRTTAPVAANRTIKVTLSVDALRLKADAEAGTASVPEPAKTK